MEELNPKRGRPREKLPVLDVGLSDTERDVYDLFVRSHMERKPEYSVAEEIHLRNAALEYVRYLRQAKQELESGKMTNQNRQSPLIQMREELKCFYGDFKPQQEAQDELTSFLTSKARGRRSS